jgi:Ni/Co efflux regulator RcnB
MKRICYIAAFSVLTTALAGPVVFAQDHQDNHHYVHHEEWKKGAHMKHEDWARGEKVDYRHYHLHEPPRGYEWREVDGNFVLAAVATGVISDIIAESAAH